MSNSKISAIITITSTDSFRHFEDCLKSLSFTDEIVIINNQSTDESVAIAKKYTDKIFSHPFSSYVEPIRNFGISKASGTWVLILDPDEVVPRTLATKLVEIADSGQGDLVRIPRKNIVFNHWLQYSRWWPDYNIRFFKKGSVTWQNEIHSIPVTNGRDLNLDPVPDQAILHNNYQSIDDYLLRLIRYSNQQTKELVDAGYKFNSHDVIQKPVAEFLSRFFAGEGYKDGFHGLVIALLQAFSILVVYLKVWQIESFPVEKNILIDRSWQKIFIAKYHELLYWVYTVKIHLTSKKTFKLIYKIKRRIASRYSHD